METQATLCGVPGTLTVVPMPGKPGLFLHQKWVSKLRTKTIEGDKILMHAEVRFDDNCKNGHNSFSVTGHGWYDHYKARDWDFGGCCHETIEKVFPELKHLIKWHFMSSDSPMHYVANTVFHASNRDHWGCLKGEAHQWEEKLFFGNSPYPVKVDKAFLEWLKIHAQNHEEAPLLEIIEVPHVNGPGDSYKFDPKFSFVGYDLGDPNKAWYKAPFGNAFLAEAFRGGLGVGWYTTKVPTAWGEGKERDFDAARSTGIWPDATDEQLSLPKEELTALLEARLPAMVAEFKAAIESTGCLLWEPENVPNPTA